MEPSRSFAWLLALPLAAAPAQTLTVTARTDGLVVRAGFRVKRRPAGPLRHGDGVQVFHVGNGCRGMARSWVELRQGASPSFGFRNFAFNSSEPGKCAVNAIAGTHSVLFTLSASKPVAGLLRMHPFITFATDLTLKYDVGDNGTYEAWKERNTYHIGRPNVPIVLGRAGVPVRITTWTATRGFPGHSLNFTNNAFVSFGAPTDLRTQGQPCGPELSARFDHESRTGARSLVVDAIGSDVTPFAWFAFGSRPLSVALPPLGCRLLTDVVVPMPASVSGAGTARAAVPIPNTHPPGDFRVQYVTGALGPGGRPTWRTSNLVRGTIR